MIIVGLTGGIATGKTTVVHMFAKEGAWVIDLDQLTRLVVEPHKPAWSDIVGYFGDTILREDKTLDRTRLGRIVFADAKKRRRLEQIVHPRALDEYEKKLKRIREKDKQAIVIADVPLLIEIKMQKQFDKVLVVYAPPASQMMRLVLRNGLSEQAARHRVNAQMSIEEKVKLADFVIDNSGSLKETRRQVRHLCGVLRELEKEKRGGWIDGTC
jgi:dephospho-CoA kinase